jgi:hypothetical protein
VSLEERQPGSRWSTLRGWEPRAGLADLLAPAVVVAARGESAEALLAKVVNELEPLRAERQKVIEAVRARSGKKKRG